MAFKALKDRKVRSALTILGIVIGSALIVALVASTGGLTSSVSGQIEKTGVTTITVSPTSPRNPLTNQDIATVKKIDGVKDVFAYYSRRLSLNYGSNTLSVTLYGIDQKKLQSLYKGLALSKGALANDYDSTGVIVGSAIANPPSGGFLARRCEQHPCPSRGRHRISSGLYRKYVFTDIFIHSKRNSDALRCRRFLKSRRICLHEFSRSSNALQISILLWPVCHSRVT